MKFLIFILTFFIAAPVIAEEIEWLRSYDTALAKAHLENKPIMMDVYTSWCKWCKVFDQKTFTDKAVIARSHDFIFVKIDGEAKSNQKLLTRYQINSFPRIIFMDDEGLVLNEVRGFLEAGPFLKEMDKSYESWLSLTDLKNNAEDKADISSIYELANIYLRSGVIDKALENFLLITSSDISNIQGLKDDAVLNIGVCYGQNGDLLKAKDQFNFYIEKYSDQERIVEAHYFLGITYLQLEEIDQSLSSFTHVYQNYPASPLAQQARDMVKRINLQR